MSAVSVSPAPSLRRTTSQFKGLSELKGNLSSSMSMASIQESKLFKLEELPTGNHLGTWLATGTKIEGEYNKKTRIFTAATLNLTSGGKLVTYKNVTLALKDHTNDKVFLVIRDQKNQKIRFTGSATEEYGTVSFPDQSTFTGFVRGGEISVGKYTK